MALLTERARQLRQSETLAEEIAWNLLRDRKAFGLKFRRQQPLGVTSWTSIATNYVWSLSLTEKFTLSPAE